MQFQRNGITVSVDDGDIERIVLDQLINDREPTIINITSLPAPQIGQEWPGQGGIYAGLMRGRDGGPDYHLIIGPEHDDDVQWQSAMDWSVTLRVDGFGDFTLPWRKEQSLCFANVPELFKERAYWSREQHASDSYYAWSQYVSYGTQNYWSKDSELRARAVRRLVIQ